MKFEFLKTRLHIPKFDFIKNKNEITGIIVIIPILVLLSPFIFFQILITIAAKFRDSITGINEWNCINQVAEEELTKLKKLSFKKLSEHSELNDPHSSIFGLNPINDIHIGKRGMISILIGKLWSRKEDSEIWVVLLLNEKTFRFITSVGKTSAIGFKKLPDESVHKLTDEELGCFT